MHTHLGLILLDNLQHPNLSTSIGNESDILYFPYTETFLNDKYIQSNPDQGRQVHRQLVCPSLRMQQPASLVSSKVQKNVNENG
jgi:hypothetical protein